MNKKAFTMVELIVVIVLIGVILVFALPNVTSTLERNKKDRMIEDAKDMVEKAKNYILTGKGNYPTNNTDSICSSGITLANLDPRGEIKDSPFGGTYLNGYVKVCINATNNEYIYKITLTDGNYKIEDKTIDDLNGNNKYTFVTK